MTVCQGSLPLVAKCKGYGCHKASDQNEIEEKEEEGFKETLTRYIRKKF